MIINIKEYVEAVHDEAKTSILNDFDISNKSEFTAFDYINFHIISKHILEDNSEDLFIGIPEDHFRDNFFDSVFYSVALIKLFQNYCSYKINQPELNQGDIVYTKDQIFTYKGVLNNKIKVQPMFPKSNQRGCDFVEIPKGIYTKLSKEFDYKKSKTIKLLKGFSDFLKEKFKDKNFPLLTEFPHKTLVIADQKYFKVNENLPTRYWTKQGNQKHQIPIDTLMEICNDFNSADTYLLGQEKTFDELIVISDSKYNDDSIFSQIQNAKWNGKIKNILLIGSMKPGISHNFKEWLWSRTEIKIANYEEPKEPNKINISAETLLNLIKILKTEVDNSHFRFGIDISYLLRYVNFYLRLILINSENAGAVIREYADRIKAHFESDEFKDRFYEKDIYDTTIINSISEIIGNEFTKIEDYFLQKNLKWDKIIELSKNNKRIYLIIEKRHYNHLKLQTKGLPNIFLISDKRIDGNTPYLDKWINSNKNNTSEKSYFIPYLNNQDTFDNLKYLMGNCFCLCYEDIDEIAFDKIQLKDKEENYARINHHDRKKFVTASFEFKPLLVSKGLESLFEIDLTTEKVKSIYEENFDAPRDDIFYEVTFDDNTADIFKSSKAIFLVDGSEQIKTTVGEVYHNATIRFYKNDSAETFNEILSIFDTNNQMAIINEFTNYWRLALKKLREIYPNSNQLYINLFKNRKIIHATTFSNYLDDRSIVRFPRKNTMEAIRDLCVASNLVDIEFVVNYDLVLRFSKEDKRIRQQAGKILGSDLIDYVASGFSEKSESLKKISDETLEKIIKSINEKKIKYKKILRNDDERIFKQSTIDFS